jgi:hypothetical protein
MVQPIIWFNRPLRPYPFSVDNITQNMGYARRSKSDQSQDHILEAIQSLERKESPSIRSAAQYFSVPYTTLRDRMAGTKSRAESYKQRQILSYAEKKTLVQWITRLTSTGFPATPTLLREMAKEIRNQRVQIMSA